MYIKIRKRTRAEWLIFYTVFLPFCFYALMDILRLPPVVKYTMDLAWIALLAQMILTKVRMNNRQLVVLLRVVVTFVAFSLVGFLLEFQSIFYYLWGSRNNLRFFVFFFACASLLDIKGIESMLKIMDKIFWLNFCVTLFQFFVLGLRQDYLGGVFGIEKGCNAYTNIFLMIVVSDHVLRYMNGRSKFLTCLYRCLGALLISVFAELKVFYIEFVIIIIMASFMAKLSGKQLWIILFGSIGLVVAIRLLEWIFPHFSDWFTISKMWETVSAKSGYTNTNDMNRVTSIFISWNEMLDTGLRKVFGLGLGNCDYASGFDFLTTPFYIKYRNLHYMWFSSAYMILETGLIGTVLYISFFVVLYRKAKQRQNLSADLTRYCQLARIMAVMCLILFIYNSSLRTEAAYMVYFVLAIPFIRLDREENHANMEQFVIE